MNEALDLPPCFMPERPAHHSTLITSSYFFFLVSMSAESCTGSISWCSPTMHRPHPLPLQPLHLPMLAASASGYFSPSPSPTPAIKPCCDQEPDIFLRLALPQHSFPLKKSWVWYLFRECQFCRQIFALCTVLGGEVIPASSHFMSFIC